MTGGGTVLPLMGTTDVDCSLLQLLVKGTYAVVTDYVVMTPNMLNYSK